jgi:M6 family metalloprotease-like protein
VYNYDDFWYGCQATWYLYEDYQLDGVKVDDYIINDAQPYADNISEYNSVLVHEIGHSMGLPDYYKYNSDDWEGLKGEAGYERMDDAIGDFCSFS